MSTDDASPGAFDDARAVGAGTEHAAVAASNKALPTNELQSRNDRRFDDALLAAKLESLAEFAAGAGHEINNPLAVISGRAQLLLRDEKDPERRRDLAIIHMQALRVYEMIADMMLFARPPLPEPTKCDVSQLVDRAVETLRAKAAVLELTIERVGLREPVEAMVDGEQMQVAVRAILDNGLNAMRPGGKIEIELHAVDAADGNSIEVIIRDDGPGISDAHREHLFDPFYSGREAGRGLGMGLSKAWRIITNHGGTIMVDPHVDSERGSARQTTTRQGATFVMRLPRRV